MAPTNVESSLSSDQASPKSCYGPARGGGSCMTNGIRKRTPVIRVVHVFAPTLITTEAANFRALVQEMTGNTANIKATAISASNEVSHDTKLGKKRADNIMQAFAQPLAHSNTASNTHEDEPSFSQHPSSERARTGRRSEESAFDGDKNNYPMLYTYPNTADGHSSPIIYNESSNSWESCGSIDDHSIDNFFGDDSDAIFHTDQQQSCSAYNCGWRLPFHQEIPGGFDYF